MKLGVIYVFLTIRPRFSPKEEKKGQAKPMPSALFFFSSCKFVLRSFCLGFWESLSFYYVTDNVTGQGQLRRTRNRVADEMGG